MVYFLPNKLSPLGTETRLIPPAVDHGINTPASSRRSALTGGNDEDLGEVVLKEIPDLHCLFPLFQ